MAEPSLPVLESYTGLHLVAARLPKEQFPVWCGRLAELQLYGLLMADDAAQRTVLNRDVPLRLLAFWSRTGSEDQGGNVRVPLKYGRSRLLRELAVQAIHDGHLVCLINEDLAADNGGYFNNPPDVMYAIRNALRNMVEYLRQSVPAHKNLAWKWRFLPQLMDLKSDPHNPPPLPPDFPPEFVERYDHKKRNPEDGDLIAWAFRLDVLALLDEIRSQRPPAERDHIRFLLLIDDVHKMGSAAGFLVKHLFGNSGILDQGAESLRTIYAYDDAKTVPGYELAVQTLKEFHEKWGRWQIATQLDAWHSTESTAIAKSFPIYKHFLLKWRSDPNTELPLALLRPESNPYVKSFLRKLATKAVGIPSKLKDHKVSDWVQDNWDAAIDPKYPREAKVLRKADDDDALSALRQSREI